MRRNREQVDEALGKAPAEVQRAFGAEETGALIMQIAQKQKLHIDQTAKLAEEVGYVMLGLEPPERFAENLMEHLAVPRDVASALTAEVNGQLFKKVRAEMHEKVPVAAPTPATTPALQAMEPQSPEVLDRAAVLKEIEAPAPAAPIFVAKPAPATTTTVPSASAPTVVTAPSAPQAAPAATTAQSAPQAAPAQTPAGSGTPDAVAQRLAGPTVTTTEHVSVGRDRSSYKIDPYREPIE